MLEGEVTTLMHTPPVITASEIKTLLPCPETLCKRLFRRLEMACNLTSLTALQGRRRQRKPGST